MSAVREEQSPRLMKWDNVRGILILSVVIGHFVQPYYDVSRAYRSLWLFIYCFHMPLFIFVAGYFHKPERLDKWRYYLILNITLSIVYCIADRMMGENAEINFTGTDAGQWFMLAMTWYVIVSYLTRTMDLKFLIGFSFFLGIGACFDRNAGDYLALLRTVVFLPFFYLGMLEREKRFFSRSKKYLLPAALLVLAVWAILSFGFFDEVRGLRPFFTGRNSYSAVDQMTNGWWIRIGVYILTSLVGGAVIILAPARRIPVLSHLGSCTLQIYVWHRIVRDLASTLLTEEFMERQGTGFRMLWILISVWITILLSHPVFKRPLTWLEKNCGRRIDVKK